LERAIFSVGGSVKQGYGRMMLELPSLWNLVISTLVFVIAAKYLHLFLEKQALFKGLTRSTLVFAITSMISWESGEMVDLIEVKIIGKQVTTQSSDDLAHLLRIVDHVQFYPTAKIQEPGSNLLH
jgi:hypothetical protein